MSDDHLVKMANDIGNFFRAETDRDEAISGIVHHIGRYWTPRMRDKLIQHWRAGDEGFDELLVEAVRRVAAQAAAKPSPAVPSR